jgi:hypothetical protein
VMSNPCISRHMFGPLPGFRRALDLLVLELSPPLWEIWARAARRRSRAHDYGILKDLPNR